MHAQGLVTAAELTDASHPYGRAYAQFQLVDNITRIVGGRRSLPARGLLEALHMDPSAELPGASELAGTHVCVLIVCLGGVGG